MVPQVVVCKSRRLRLTLFHEIMPGGLSIFMFKISALFVCMHAETVTGVVSLHEEALRALGDVGAQVSEGG